MEHESFWRDRESRFLALTTPRLSAVRSDADIAQILADSSDHLLRVFLDKVYDGIRLEARITGTEAPQQQQIETRMTLEDLVVSSLIKGDGKKPSHAGTD